MEKWKLSGKAGYFGLHLTLVTNCRTLCFISLPCSITLWDSLFYCLPSIFTTLEFPSKYFMWPYIIEAKMITQHPYLTHSQVNFSQSGVNFQLCLQLQKRERFLSLFNSHYSPSRKAHLLLLNIPLTHLLADKATHDENEHFALLKKLSIARVRQPQQLTKPKSHRQEKCNQHITHLTWRIS